jgi:hypothetical protein
MYISIYEETDVSTTIVIDHSMVWHVNFKSIILYCLKLPTVNINRIVVKRDQSRFMQRKAKMIPHKLSSNDIEHDQ